MQLGSNMVSCTILLLGLRASSKALRSLRPSGRSKPVASVTAAVLRNAAININIQNP